jgi:hypothetical protein
MTPDAPRPRLLALALTLLVAAGCGNLTAGGLSEAEVAISGDAPDPTATAFRAPWHDGPARQDDDDDDDDDDDEAEGELEADLRLFLEDDVGDLVSLTDDALSIDVDLQGVNEVTTGTRAVPTGRYRGLHVLFLDVEVEIEGGLVVGGEPVTGRVDVEFEADSLDVVLPLDLRLEEGDRVAFLVDLNAQDWLVEVDPDVRVVAERFFANAIRVRVR